MKFSELKNKFKNKYAIRVIAGVLMVAMLGTSYGVWQVNAAKPSTESVSEETTEKEASTEDTDAENADAEDRIRHAGCGCAAGDGQGLA